MNKFYLYKNDNFQEFLEVPISYFEQEEIYSHSDFEKVKRVHGILFVL